MLDMTAAGGYGRLYGPNVDAQGTVVASEGKVPGTEYIAFADDGTGRQNVTLMVQVPASFDPKKPCVITATASGSRGVYGGISTGEWGLKRGCAVAYSDKGTGGAPHDLQNDTVPLIDGTRTTATAAGKEAAFNAGLSPSELAAFNAATPNRFAFKHAHSGQNPEKDWGKTTLPKGTGMGVAFHYSHLGYFAEVVQATVSKAGAIKVDKVWCAGDIGSQVINASHAENQTQGGVLDGIAEALAQEITIDKGRVVQTNFGTTATSFQLLRMRQACPVEVHFLKSNNSPTGLGEPMLPPAVPALVNAIYAATGKRVRSLPLSKADLKWS